MKNSVEPIEVQGMYNPENFDTTTKKEGKIEGTTEGTIYGDNSVVEQNEKTEENEIISCVACYKNFTTKSSLTRHLDRSPVCKKWLSDEISAIVKCEVENTKENNNIVSICDFIEDLKNKLITDSNFRCKHCSVTYSSVGNLNKHYKTSVACNRLAYIAFDKEIKDFVLSKRI